MKEKIILYIGVLLFIALVSLGIYGLLSYEKEDNNKELFSIEQNIDKMKQLNSYTLNKSNHNGYNIKFSTEMNGYYFEPTSNNIPMFLSLETKKEYLYSENIELGVNYYNEFTNGSILTSDILKGKLYTKENEHYIRELDGNSSIVQDFLSSYYNIDDLTYKNVNVDVILDNEYIKTVTFDYELVYKDGNSKKEQLVLNFKDYNEANFNNIDEAFNEYITITNLLAKKKYTDTFDITLNDNHTIKVEYNLEYELGSMDNFVTIAHLYYDDKELNEYIEIPLNVNKDNILSLTLEDIQNIGINSDDLTIINGSDDLQYLVYTTNITTELGTSKTIYVYDEQAFLVKAISAQIPGSNFTCKNARCYYGDVNTHARIKNNTIQFYHLEKEIDEFVAIEYEMTFLNSIPTYKELKQYKNVEIIDGNSWEYANPK